MSSAFAKAELHKMTRQESSAAQLGSSHGIELLGNEHRDELLAFLARRPIHTVCMGSFVRDNGVVSPLNRGVFYGYRNHSGALDGVALIGHATLLESESEDALKAFAELSHNATPSHLIRGEHRMIDRFWMYYAQLGHQARLTCHELLFQHETIPYLPGLVPDLRPATLHELEEIAEINAGMVVAECGVNPLQKDPEGFHSRLARRIQRERIWVWRKNDQVIFKADLFAETPEMIYLEGIFVNPNERGRGIGQRCLSHLSRLLLHRSNSLCLLVNQQTGSLEHFYKSAGFGLRGTYETIYFSPKTI